MERFDGNDRHWEAVEDRYEARTPSRLARSVSWATQHLDRAMLTGVKTFMGLGIPRLERREAHELLDSIGRFYSLETARKDPDAFFPHYDEPTNLEARKRRKHRRGDHVHLVWQTPHEPKHPSYRDEFARYDRIHDVHLFGWRHMKPAPASILLTHD